MSQRKTTNPHDSERRKQVRRRKSPQGSETEELSGAIYRGGTPESQVNTLAQLSRPQQQTAIHNIGKIQGNRRAAQVVAHLQRHPGHDSLNPEQEQTVDGLAANLQRQISPVIMRAELLQDENQRAVVNPLQNGNVPLLSAPRAGAVSRGNLVARNELTILRRNDDFAYVHVRSGPLAGAHGYVSTSGTAIIVVAAAAPTSLRTPTTGTENAYSQLQAELAKPTPSRSEIFFIVLQRMTAAQQQRLLRSGNAEWEKLAALDVISADHLFNLLSLMGTKLKRKLTEYTEWHGRDVAKLRLAFATATNDERVEVARDDELIGELRPILGRIHPQMIFGPVLEQVYPPDGKIGTLRTTHPNLARWLSLGRFASRRTNLRRAANARSRLLTSVLTEITPRATRRSRLAVMQAVYQSPRGMALPIEERNALDQIAVHAYNQTIYSSSNMATMFLTRFGQPLAGGSRYPKTFIHRLWQTLRKLPDDHAMLNNVLTSFNLNQDPTAAGSFTLGLGDKDFGMIRSNLPVAAESLHVDGNQNSQSIRVREPYVDLFKPNDGVMIAGRTGNEYVRVHSVNPRSRRLGVSKRVNVNDGALIVPISTQTSVTTNTLRADGAQHSRNIRVQEPHVALFRNGVVKVEETNERVTEARVRWVNPRSRRLGLSRRVNIGNGAKITLTGQAPVVKVVHAAAAQNSDRLRIIEPYAELFRGEVVSLVQTNGWLTRARVDDDSSGNILELSQPVRVRRGATITPSRTLADWETGAALRIQTNTQLMADIGNYPSRRESHGLLQAGIMVAKLGEERVGADQYFKVRVLKGGPSQQMGWILASSITGMGMSAREAVFEWTLRHEMGHALDLQINGFSQFSAPSAAKWRKYTGVNDWVADLINTAGIANPDTKRVLNNVDASFRLCAEVYSQAVQSEKTTTRNSLLVQRWLRAWVAAGGSQAVYDTITQYNANPWYYSQNNVGLPPLGGRIFGAHYDEWYSSAGEARTHSLAAGVSPYAYTCTHEFFADHYASYTGPGSGGQTYARAVPVWAQDFFDRLVGRGGAGPRVGMKRHRMDKG